MISFRGTMAEFFSEKQIGQFRELFDSFDKNGDGHITADELKCVLKSLGQKVKTKVCKQMIVQVCLLNLLYNTTKLENHCYIIIIILSVGHL